MKKFWIKLSAWVMVFVTTFALIAATQAVSYRVFTIGDSTVQNYNDGYAPRKGWGQMLQSYFSSADVQVINKAVGGTSSKSFYDYFWSGVKSEMRAGDFVFIQFGINDRNRGDAEREAYGDVFKGYLRNYVNEARAMGAVPVLVSTVRRISWNNGAPYDSYHEHPQLVREVAAELNVALIDLDTKHKNGMIEVGQWYSERMWSNSYVPGEYPNYRNGNTDQVHFQEMGAIQLADYVIEGIKELSNHADVSKLIPFIKPQYEIKVLSNHPDAGIVTRTATYPAGLNIHLKALAHNGHNFINWKDNNGTLITSNNLFQFTSGTADQTYVAYFDDENPFSVDCNGDINGSAVLDNCGICSGGNTGVTACSAFLQGEEACEIDGILLESSNPGFGGAGYANTTNEVGAKILWNIASDEAQEVEVSFRFANGGAAARNMTLILNGNTVSEMVFNPTGSFANWSLVSTNLNLNKGGNVVELVALTSGGGPNIDVLTFDVENVYGGTCGTDCKGDLYGGAYIDECNTCVSGNTGLEACTQDCNGDWGGTAVLDNCGTCVGGNSAYQSCTGSLETETACAVDGILSENVNPGFSGEGYVNTTNTNGAAVSWVLNSTEAQTATLTFRYANGGTTNRSGEIWINNALVTELSLPGTGSWETWEQTSVNLTLQKGANDIQLVANTADGLANLDVIHFSDGVSDAQCGLITGGNTYETTTSHVYPNPTTGNISWNKESEWVLLNTQGKEVAHGKGKEANLTNQANGIYFLKIEGKIIKLMKQ